MSTKLSSVQNLRKDKLLNPFGEKHNEANHQANQNGPALGASLEHINPPLHYGTSRDMIFRSEIAGLPYHSSVTEMLVQHIKIYLNQLVK
jgi:hypothetical protein